MSPDRVHAQQERNQKMHEQRLYEISSGKRRGSLGVGGIWAPFSHGRRTTHPRQPEEADEQRFDAINENQLLLEDVRADDLRLDHRPDGGHIESSRACSSTS